jgi:hypothetical protein
MSRRPGARNKTCAFALRLMDVDAESSDPLGDRSRQRGPIPARGNSDLLCDTTSIPNRMIGERPSLISHFLRAYKSRIDKPQHCGRPTQSEDQARSALVVDAGGDAPQPGVQVDVFRVRAHSGVV